MFSSCSANLRKMKGGRITGVAAGEGRLDCLMGARGKYVPTYTTNCVHIYNYNDLIIVVIHISIGRN